MPFANSQERALHFAKHGHKFSAASELEYEQMADKFMCEPMPLTRRECNRPNGTDRVRFDVASNHFGVAVVASTIVKTYYIVKLFTIKHHGGKAAFFTFECGRTDV